MLGIESGLRQGKGKEERERGRKRGEVYFSAMKRLALV